MVLKKFDSRLICQILGGGNRGDWEGNEMDQWENQLTQTLPRKIIDHNEDEKIQHLKSMKWQNDKMPKKNHTGIQKQW